MKQEIKIKCGCHGHPSRGIICMYVTVGGRYCTKPENCSHQVKEEKPEEGDKMKIGDSCDSEGQEEQ